MKTLLSGLLSIALLSACSVVPEKVQSGKLVPVENGEHISLESTVLVIEKRPPFGIELEWRLQPGEYIEQHQIPEGRVFVGQGELLEFTSSAGVKDMTAGGFVVLRDQPDMAKLYQVREANENPLVTETAVMLVGGGAIGDLLFITEFPLADLQK